MRLAVEQDPLNVSWRAVTASHLVHAGMFDEAIAEAQKAIDMDPRNSAARFILVEAYLDRAATRHLGRAEATQAIGNAAVLSLTAADFEGIASEFS